MDPILLAAGAVGSLVVLEIVVRTWKFLRIVLIGLAVLFVLNAAMPKINEHLAKNEPKPIPEQPAKMYIQPQLPVILEKIEPPVKIEPWSGKMPFTTEEVPEEPIIEEAIIPKARPDVSEQPSLEIEVRPEIIRPVGPPDENERARSVSDV